MTTEEAIAQYRAALAAYHTMKAARQVYAFETRNDGSDEVREKLADMKADEDVGWQKVEESLSGLAEALAAELHSTIDGPCGMLANEHRVSLAHKLLGIGMRPFGSRIIAKGHYGPDGEMILDWTEDDDKDESAAA